MKRDPLKNAVEKFMVSQFDYGERRPASSASSFLNLIPNTASILHFWIGHVRSCLIFLFILPVSLW